MIVLFSLVAAPFHIPTNSTQGCSSFSTSLSTCIFSFLTSTILMNASSPGIFWSRFLNFSLFSSLFPTPSLPFFPLYLLPSLPTVSALSVCLLFLPAKRSIYQTYFLDLLQSKGTTAWPLPLPLTPAVATRTEEKNMSLFWVSYFKIEKAEVQRNECLGHNHPENED